MITITLVGLLISSGGIADDVLRDVYVRGKYRDVILPMTVIRRLDAVLEPTKQNVLNMKKRLDEDGIVNQDGALRTASGHPFYNASPYTLRDLRAIPKAQQLKADLRPILTVFPPIFRRYWINSSSGIKSQL